MRSKLANDREFIVEMFSTLAVAAAELVFLISALLQSGGLVFYRFYDGNSGFYHTKHIDITSTLLPAVLILILLELAIGALSWRRKLNLIRIAIPVEILVFAGIMCQAFLYPQGLTKHLVMLTLGMLVFGSAAIYLINYPFSKTTFDNICITAILFSVVCLSYGLFNKKGGNGGWFMGTQPGEFFKIGMLLLCCVGYHYIRTDRISRYTFFIAIFTMFMAVFGVRDLGNAVIVAGLIAVILISLGQVKLTAALAACGTLIGAAVFAVKSKTDPTGRLVQRISQSLFYPLTHYINSDTNQNIRQALLALVRGGIFGTGVSGSNALYASNVFAARTDFTFVCAVSIFGLLFGIVILIAYCILTLNVSVSLKNAKTSHSDLYQANIITCLFLLQCIVHILGSLSLIPMTGVTLPFISSGGSSTAASFIAVGALVGLYLPDTHRKRLAAFRLPITIPEKWKSFIKNQKLRVNDRLPVDISGTWDLAVITFIFIKYNNDRIRKEKHNEDQGF